MGLKKNVKTIIDDIHKPMNDVNSKLDKLEETSRANLNKIESINNLLENNIEKIESIENTLQVQNEALLGLEKSGLLDNCERCIKQGFADRNHRNMIEKQYNSYVALGDGSEFVKDMVETVKNLPFEKTKSSSKKQLLNE